MFLLALGFYHMQSAFDRDDYVIVFWDNIMENQKHNFHKSLDTQVAYFNTSYDLDSIMHYEEFAFSINGEQTMIPVVRVDLLPSTNVTDWDVLIVLHNFTHK